MLIPLAWVTVWEQCLSGQGELNKFLPSLLGDLQGCVRCKMHLDFWGAGNILGDILVLWAVSQTRHSGIFIRVIFI